MENLEPGDVVLCTVDRIVGTIVFVNIDDTGLEGSIVLSEIAPGRIRNLRSYVVPKKKIVCKILRIKDKQIQLSLRRVTQKEEKEVKVEYKQEKSSESILKGILKEKAKEIIKKIKQKNSVYEFLQNSKVDSKELENLVSKSDAKKILEIINKQKKKKAEIKKQIKLTSKKPDGIKLIKNILGKLKNAKIKYISAGKYSIKVTDENPKKADNKLKEILQNIEKQAKENQMEFSVKEK
ncbi:MAG: hypothetical protein PVJ67_02735 [Candidatus Pacearchaeota archaeon]|jgi:translation initiation factor 2 alpha subunit (eIF-2alpha)